MRFVSAGTSDNGAPLALDDPLAGRLRSVVAAASTPSTIVAALLSLPEVFPPDLADDGTFRTLLTEAVEALSRLGAAAAVATLGRESAA
jgi:fructuronate reductase